MKIDNVNDILCENPIEIGRYGQGCDYTYKGKFLFHERSFFPWNIFKESLHHQWFCQFNLTKAECEEIVKPYGKDAYACEDFYADGYFPVFSNNNKAVEFCQTEIFDNLSASLAKMLT